MFHCRKCQEPVTFMEYVQYGGHAGGDCPLTRAQLEQLGEDE